MDNTKYKELVVARGFTYRYYHSAPSDGKKPTLLFVHGFPSSSYDWHHQVTHFQALGYGILAPDLLGAGGTSKPTEWQVFRLNAMAADVVCILDKEGLDKVVGVGHDWGSVLLARLSLLHQERFHGFIWLALALMEPITQHFDLEAAMQFAKGWLGYESYAYWQFFTEPGAAEIVKKNRDSYVQLLYPKDPDLWRTWMVVRGKTAECVKNNIKLGRAEYLRDEDYETFLKETENFSSAVNWYVSQMNDNDLEDNNAIPKEQWKMKKPSLFVGATKDCICTPQMSHGLLEKYGPDSVEIQATEAGHWLHLEKPVEVNRFMEDWLSRLNKQIS